MQLRGPHAYAYAKPRLGEMGLLLIISCEMLCACSAAGIAARKDYTDKGMFSRSILKLMCV